MGNTVLRTFTVAVALVATITAMPATAAEDPPQTLRRSGIGDPATLDPHLWVDGWEGNIVQDLFVGLTTLDAAVNVVPGAAESWTLSDDGRTYTFLLREGMTWSDGEPLTAEDFVFSFRRIMDPQTASPSAALLYDIKNGKAVNTGEAPVETLAVRALDPRRVEIELNEPTPYFPEIIVHRGLPAPRHAIAKHGRSWARPGTFVSNGAYVLDEWIPQVHVRLARNPRFFAADAVRLEVIYHMPAEDLDTGFRQYRAGEIDILSVIPPNRLDWARENLGDELHLTSIIGLDYYVFNVKRPPFDDVRVRRALSMAVESGDHHPAHHQGRRTAGLQPDAAGHPQLSGCTPGRFQGHERCGPRGEGARSTGRGRFRPGQSASSSPCATTPTNSTSG